MTIFDVDIDARAGGPHPWNLVEWPQPH